jgi:ribosome-binding protein aMBF1 (putative translation factor)
MITCDLCGQAKDCLQKEIEGREYDICPDCWRPLERKLRGKGRAKKELVILPPPEEEEKTRREEEEPGPGEPPKIWASPSN